MKKLFNVVLGALVGSLLVPQQIGASEPPNRYELILDLSERQLVVYQLGLPREPISVYDVAVGKDGFKTPVGEHTISSKVICPTFSNPFNGSKIKGCTSRNPLGTRALVFGKYKNGVRALHGGLNASTVGKAVSHSCVRLFNGDIQELYDLVQFETKLIVKE